MERVETLIQKLQEQFTQKASVDKLLLTVQMLQHELLHYKENNPEITEQEKVVVSLPVEPITSIISGEELKPEETVVEEEKIIEVLQIDEAEVEAELEEIKRNAAAIQQITSVNKPQGIFNINEDHVPTLPTKKENDKKEINDIAANETLSLNEKLSKPAAEVSEKLTATPVKDLKKAIGVNDRFLFINELFRGDEAMYERSIKTINSFSILPEAEYWIRRELKTKLGWSDADKTVVEFDQLVKRRFA